MKKRKSNGKLNKLLSISFIAMFLGVTALPYTNAEFLDQYDLPGATVSAGWWVVPTVKVNYPNGGEIFSIGDKVIINWDAASADPSSDLHIKIYLSTDSGSSYTLLKDNLLNVDNYLWEVNTKSTTMRVRVEVTDDHGLTNLDESDADFDPDDKDLEPTQETTDEEHKEDIKDENKRDDSKEDSRKEQTEETDVTKESTPSIEPVELTNPIEAKELTLINEQPEVQEIGNTEAPVVADGVESPAEVVETSENISIENQDQPQTSEPEQAEEVTGNIENSTGEILAND